MVFTTSDPINPNELYAKVSNKSSGSVVFHYAIVREKTADEITKFIDFKSNGNTEEELKKIADDLKSKWELEDVLIARRMGKLGIGDIISLVAVSSAHRHDAFDACLYGVDSLKRMKTIIKTEY